jgi:hypothetical protein
VIKILGKLRFLLVIIYRGRVCTQKRQPNTMNIIVTFHSLIFFFVPLLLWRDKHPCFSVKVRSSLMIYQGNQSFHCIWCITRATHLLGSFTYRPTLDIVRISSVHCNTMRRFLLWKTARRQQFSPSLMRSWALLGWTVSTSTCWIYFALVWHRTNIVNDSRRSKAPVMYAFQSLVFKMVIRSHRLARFTTTCTVNIVVYELI